MSLYRTAIKKFAKKSTFFVTAAAFTAICTSYTVFDNANFSGDWR